MCLYMRVQRFGQDKCTVQEAANLHAKRCVVEHSIVLQYFLIKCVQAGTLPDTVIAAGTSYSKNMLNSQTHRSLKCLGLKYSPNCICCIVSYLNIAQQQRELIYLWQPWRGQHFFHTFEKSLGGRKWTSRNCCIICTWVGIAS